MITRMQLLALAGSCCLALVLVSGQAQAQFMGHNFKGDFGLMSGTQPGPGFYLTGAYVRYDGDTINDKDGNSLTIDPEESGELDSQGIAIGFWYVAPFKIFGANYGFMTYPAFTNNKFEVPILGVEEKTSLAFTDLYVQPINLGWHTKQADIMTGLGVYIPTGSYDPEASDNSGLGMWSFELAAGGTIFFDQAKTWNFATMGYFETHTEKKDTDFRVGNILTLEGGLGKSFMGGGVNVGLAYYAQWKLSPDDLGAAGDSLGITELPKNQVFGFGPDVTVPLVIKSKLIATITARYFWETGAKTTLEGRTFVAMATFPIPSVSLN